MIDEIAFIGDVHGHVLALESILRAVLNRRIPEAVLLGDYVNKGPASKEVLNLLTSWNNQDLELQALQGNHERVFLSALDSGDLRPLLKMAGAPTVRSYVGGDVGSDAFADFSASVPDSHREFLKSLPHSYYSHGVTARHEQTHDASSFVVSAHVNIGFVPIIDATSARIDTGCGSGGRLTAFFWPSRAYIQCTEAGGTVA